MFVRVMKHKIVCLLTYIVLGAFCLYNGISCFATLYKADKQPYLLSGTERFHFMGYHMLAALHGAICIILVAMLMLFVRWRRKTKSKGINSLR